MSQLKAKHYRRDFQVNYQKFVTTSKTSESKMSKVCERFRIVSKFKHMFFENWRIEFFCQSRNWSFNFLEDEWVVYLTRMIFVFESSKPAISESVLIHINSLSQNSTQQKVRLFLSRSRSETIGKNGIFQLENLSVSCSNDNPDRPENQKREISFDLSRRLKSYFSVTRGLEVLSKVPKGNSALQKRLRNIKSKKGCSIKSLTNQEVQRVHIVLNCLEVPFQFLHNYELEVFPGWRNWSLKRLKVIYWRNCSIWPWLPSLPKHACSKSSIIFDTPW